jgi:hypothetical protein
MKLYWNQISTATKVQILISEYVHSGKLEVIEEMPQVHELEDELGKRGVIWDRNFDMMGSEHLYIESAIVHVDTYFRANKAKLGILRLFAVKCSAYTDTKARALCMR